MGGSRIELDDRRPARAGQRRGGHVDRWLQRQRLGDHPGAVQAPVASGQIHTSSPTAWAAAGWSRWRAGQHVELDLPRGWRAPTPRGRSAVRRSTTSRRAPEGYLGSSHERSWGESAYPDRWTRTIGSAYRKGWRLIPAWGEPPADAGLEEAVDIAVEDGAGLPDLVLGAEVLDHLVRVQDVGPHLVAPGRFDIAGELLLGRRLLLLLEQEQPDFSTQRATRFWICDFSFCIETTMPVGRWVIRTAESVVLTDCRPGPRNGRRRSSARSRGCRCGRSTR